MRWHGMDPERGAFLGMSLLLGARGLGALIGPLLNAPWAGKSQARLRLGILFGYLACATGYALLGVASHLWVACLCIVLAHIGGSTVWVFSTTLLQLNTEDKFSRPCVRGRPGILHAHHRCRRVYCRALCGLGLRGTARRKRGGIADVNPCGFVGMEHQKPAYKRFGCVIMNVWLVCPSTASRHATYCRNISTACLADRLRHCISQPGA